MNSNSLHPARHKKVLYLISLPDTPDFQKYESDISRCVSKLNALGVDVRTEISENILQSIKHYDVVVVVSHLDEEKCELVLSQTRMDIASFVCHLPVDFDGILDFSSCHSAQWMSAIKANCPNCHVLGSVGQTTLPYRLYIYPYVMEVFLSEESIDYQDAYRMVQDYVKNELRENGSIDKENHDPATKLGKKMSSVYAPSKVTYEQPFMVQLFLHEASDNIQKVTLQAKKFDPKTCHVETEELSVQLKKGDSILVSFSIFSARQEFFTIDEPVKTAKWNGKMAKFQFNAIVSKQYPSESFIGKLMIEVNHEPVGNCSFSIVLANNIDEAPAPTTLEARNPAFEGEECRRKLKEMLQNNLNVLQSNYNSDTTDDVARDKLKKSMDICELCIHLVENPILQEKVSKPRKVFISSTCEDFMKPFRDAARDAITKLKMKPEMCDDWPQSGCNPTNLCCQKVLESDIYMGVFGGRYGYVEPSLNSSMTQVEYLTALSANKTMLLFILNPLNQTDEPASIRQRQNDFINELKKNRIIRTFTKPSDLYDFAINDLLDYLVKN